MTDRSDTFRDCRITIALSFLKVSNLYTIPCGFYGSPNGQIGCVKYACFPKSGHIYNCGIDSIWELASCM